VYINNITNNITNTIYTILLLQNYINIVIIKSKNIIFLLYMMFFMLMFLFILTRHFKKHYILLSNNLIFFSENQYFLNKNITGCDERYEKNMTLVNITTTYEMEKIYLLQNKKRILDKLQDNSISTNIKLTIIDNNIDNFIDNFNYNYNIKPNNLKAGGLFKDSDFEM